MYNGWQPSLLYLCCYLLLYIDFSVYVNSHSLINFLQVSRCFRSAKFWGCQAEGNVQSQGGSTCYRNGLREERKTKLKNKAENLTKMLNFEKSSQFVNITLANITRTYQLVFKSNFTCLPNVLTNLIAQLMRCFL